MMIRRLLTKDIWLTVLMAASVIISGCVTENKAQSNVETFPRPVKAERVTAAVSEFSKSYPGKIQAASKVDLAFRISGPLVAFPVDEGDIVEKGGVIARIDPRDYKTALLNIESGLKEANANLAAMEKGARIEDIRALEAKVDAIKAKYVEALKHFERAETLLKEKVLSKADYDRFLSGRDVAKAELNAAEQELEKARKGAREEDIRAMKSRIEGLLAKKAQAEDALSDTVLKAPFTGVVARKYVENYQDVLPKAPVVNIQDASNLEVIISVPESDMPHFKNPGLAFSINLESTNQGDINANIKSLSPEADPITRTYQVTLMITTLNNKNVLPGMTATVFAEERNVKDESQVFSLPVNALTADENNAPYVFAVNESDLTVNRRNVVIGDFIGGIGNKSSENSDRVTILKGISKDELIVTAGAKLLTDGQKIRLFNNDNSAGVNGGLK